MSLAGFSILPLRYLAGTTHTLYVRAHVGTARPDLPAGRTLFIVNIPPDATAHELGALFSHHGTVERVLFSGAVAGVDNVDDDDADSDPDVAAIADPAPASASDSDSEADTPGPRKRRKLAVPVKTRKPPKPAGPPPLVALPPGAQRLHPSGSSAHLVFLDASSLARALSSLSPRDWPPASSEARGLAYYIAVHAAMRPAHGAILAHAESFIQRYDHALSLRKRTGGAAAGPPPVDEDGFTLVVRGGAYGQSIGGGVSVASKRFETSGAAQLKKKKKKKQAQEAEGFYGFRVRERNLKHQADLRRKFEEDKAKIAEMQSKRGFVPY